MIYYYLLATVVLLAIVTLVLLHLIIISLAFVLLKYLQHEQQKVFSTDIKMSNLQIQKSMYALTFQEKPNVAAVKGSTSYLDFSRIRYFINDTQINTTTYDHHKLSSIVKQSKNNQITDDHTIFQLVNKHKEFIKNTLNIDDTTCCNTFHNRIAMAAIFEYAFQQEVNITPNIDIIHEIVSHCNQAGNFAMPYEFFKEILKKCKEFDINRIFPKNLKASFTIENKDKVTCCISADVTIHKHDHEDQKYTLPFKLTFSMLSNNSTDLSHVKYRNTTLEITVPNAIKQHVTTHDPIPTDNTSLSIDDQITLIDKSITENNDICLKYSLPNFITTSLINRKNLDMIQHNNIPVQSCSMAIQQHHNHES